MVGAGERGVERACEWLKSHGAKRALLLQVSAPFHCSLMKPAAQRLKDRLQSTPLAPPTIAVVNNVDAQVHSDPQAIRDALYRQAFGPVRWVETVLAMRARGVNHIFECGPGKVVAGLVRRIDPSIVTGTVLDPATLTEIRGLLA